MPGSNADVCVSRRGRFRIHARADGPLRAWTSEPSVSDYVYMSIGTLLCPMLMRHREYAPLAHTGARKTPVPVFTDSPLKQREKERGKEGFFSSPFNGAAHRYARSRGPSSAVVWRTFRERRRGIACVRSHNSATAMPEYHTEPRNSMPFLRSSLALSILAGCRCEDA